MNGQERFDVYILSPCREAPGASARGPADLENEPGSAERWSAAGQGFAGVDVDLETGRRVLALISACRGKAMLVPPSYREPKVSVRDALLAARRHIRTHYPEGPVFRPPRLADGSNPYFWSVMADCPRWQADDLIPGALTFAVDKMDGHFWEKDEMRACWSRVM